MVRALSVIVRCTASALIVLASSACGEDDSMRGPLDAGRPAITQPVAAPAAPSASSAGTRATPVLPLPVACGANECTRPPNLAADLLMKVTGLPMTGAETVACCLDEEQSVCSSAASLGASCDTVAVMDNRCPGVDLSALADLVGGLFDSTQDAKIGCCTHGACGLNGQMFGRGCVENAEAKRMLSVVPVIGPLINVPAPRACELDEPAEPANDAGT